MNEANEAGKTAEEAVKARDQSLEELRKSPEDVITFKKKITVLQSENK